MSKRKKRNYKNQDITDNSFDFVKSTCTYCGKRINNDKLFCSMECKTSYFEKRQQIKDGKYVSKKKQDKKKVYGLSDILSPEQLEEMMKESENYIDKKMKKLKQAYLGLFKSTFFKFLLNSLFLLNFFRKLMIC